MSRALAVGVVRRHQHAAEPGEGLHQGPRPGRRIHLAVLEAARSVQGGLPAGAGQGVPRRRDVHAQVQGGPSAQIVGLGRLISEMLHVALSYLP